MIFAWLGARGLLGLAKGWWLLIAAALIVAAVAGFNLWLAGERREAVEADRSASKAEAVSRAREADERAHGAAAATREGIAEQNRSAADAAAQSDDPLKAGLDKLREQKR